MIRQCIKAGIIAGGYITRQDWLLILAIIISIIEIIIKYLKDSEKIEPEGNTAHYRSYPFGGKTPTKDRTSYLFPEA